MNKKGSERTREELIPYLVDIIEECDNDEEFLLKLSDELLELKDKIGGQEFIVKLVEPLEILSSMEE
jgi:serine/threonine-protein phosphatase 2A regulatory subunit A